MVENRGHFKGDCRRRLQQGDFVGELMRLEERDDINFTEINNSVFIILSHTINISNRKGNMEAIFCQQFNL